MAHAKIIHKKCINDVDSKEHCNNNNKQITNKVKMKLSWRMEGREEGRKERKIGK